MSSPLSDYTNVQKTTVKSIGNIFSPPTHSFIIGVLIWEAWPTFPLDWENYHCIATLIITHPTDMYKINSECFP